MGTPGSDLDDEFFGQEVAEPGEWNEARGKCLLNPVHGLVIYSTSLRQLLTATIERDLSDTVLHRPI